jgi:hypothetical protein
MLVIYMIMRLLFDKSRVEINNRNDNEFLFYSNNMIFIIQTGNYIFRALILMLYYTSQSQLAYLRIGHAEPPTSHS